ncbi:signal peptidase complex subunit 3-like isoform X2 [Watersipora subatra]|uniref:signal peptidase complex subunit 3-like isoform X2 n=1 Tax=Watersipora subatra TaxID=2589382 RepID=UPI00355B8199
MNTILARLNAAFAYTLSVMAVLTFLCFASTYMNDNLADIEIKAGSVIVKDVSDFTTDRAKRDLATLSNVGVKVDLSQVFNWNVKEIFLYLTAEYSSDLNAVNQVVLWDKIVMRENDQVVDVPSVEPKYYFFDDSRGLIGNSNVTLTLSWNVIPNDGRLPRVQGIGSTVLKLPNTYLGSRF